MASFAGQLFSDYGLVVHRRTQSTQQSKDVMMLTLTRNLDLPTILIGDDIKIHITAISGGQVKVSIDAPREIDIKRGELRWRQGDILGAK